MTQTKFWASVNTICQMHHASVVSGYRTKTKNQELGGHPTSPHLMGLAADIELDDWSTKAQAIKTIRLLGIMVVDESTTKNHLHLHTFGF